MAKISFSYEIYHTKPWQINLQSPVFKLIYALVACACFYYSIERFRAYNKWYLISNPNSFESLSNTPESDLSDLSMWDQILRNDLNYIVLKADDAQLKNNYSKAIHFLLLAKQVSADKNIDYKLAEAYENLRNYPEADSVYRRVTYALPALLYPHYRLVKLYHKTRQLDKLQKEIHIIRKLRVKISSKDTDKMMKEIELLY